ncbi:MAG: hypothetical protein HRU11_05360, partial [Parvularculaceae bacterium]|nr:hypothetical protein [Parvularculaceae bacterium]
MIEEVRRRGAESTTGLRRRITVLADRLGAAERRQPRYDGLLSTFCLLVVILGFAKSFFLRPLFPNFPVAPIVLVHGGVLSAWFVLFWVQTNLVRRGQAALHRRLGLASLPLALAAIATIVPTTYGFPARRWAADVPGYSFEADLEHITMVVHGNTAMLVLFALFYSGAIWKRHHWEWHSRWMALASMVIVTPAASRLLTVVGDAGVTSQPL